MIHKVITFHISIMHLLFYLNDQRKEDQGGGDKRKGTANVGELLHNLIAVCTVGLFHRWSEMTPA